MQESAFARSGWSNDGDHLALPQTQVRVGQNRQTFLAAAVNFLQTSGFHDDTSAARGARRAPTHCLARVVRWLGHSSLKLDLFGPADSSWLSLLRCYSYRQSVPQPSPSFAGELPKSFPFA